MVCVLSRFILFFISSNLLAFELYFDVVALSDCFIIVQFAPQTLS